MNPYTGSLFTQNPEAHLMYIKSLAMKLKISLAAYTKTAEKAYRIRSKPWPPMEKEELIQEFLDEREKVYKDLIQAGYEVMNAMFEFRKSVMDLYYAANKPLKC